MMPSSLVYYRNDLGACCFRVCGRQFLWNPGVYLPNFAVSLPRTLLLCQSPPRESHIVHWFISLWVSSPSFETRREVHFKEDRDSLDLAQNRRIECQTSVFGVWTLGFCFQI